MAAYEMRPRELALFDADLLASVAPYLGARDLVNLSLACRRFGAVDRGGNNGEEGASLPPVQEAPLPLVQETVRRAIVNEQTKVEKAALVRYSGESWIASYHQLLMLRAPLTFDVLAGKDLEYDDGNKSRVIGTPLRFQSAISKHIMRGGKHYAEFSEVRGHFVLAGLMRPIPAPIPSGLGKLQHFHPAHLRKEVRLQILQGRSERWGGSGIDCCGYNFSSGQCVCSNWEENQAECHDWEGREGLGQGQEDYVGVLGLLLDLDAGTLTAYKSGRRLGVMCEGLGGEYCWVASVTKRMNGVSGISIKRGAIPYDA